MFESWEGAYHLPLDVAGERGGDAVEVVFVGVVAFGFEEDVVSAAFGEADDLVLEGGAVACADAVDASGEHGGAVEVLLDDGCGLLVGVGEEAGSLLESEVVEDGELLGVCGEEGELAVEGVWGLEGEVA